ncbi:MAG: hypothetical protein V6Z89_12095 [Desulfobacter sp.]
MANDKKAYLIDWIDCRQHKFSRWHGIIWHYAEPAWREYRSAAWYCALLEDLGWDVEKETGGMPTAFRAQWTNGNGPVTGGYAEYDAVPHNCQAASTRPGSRDGLGENAPGHTDPHSALGMGSLAGFLAAQAAMKQYDIPGKLVFFGEPAEKVRGSKPIHAANGYYDGLDAAISFHPFYMMPLCNTVRWDTHCGAGYNLVYTFECNDPQTWLSREAGGPIPAAHAASRAPGANDALMAMYTLSKMNRESIHSTGSCWSMNEAILTAGLATADNLPARTAQINYMIRTSTVEMCETAVAVLDRNADAAAKASHCTWKRTWVAKSRPGLPNHAMAEATYKNLELCGPPAMGSEAVETAREIQKNLGLEPMDAPFFDACSKTIPPKEAEHRLRQLLPDWVTNFTSDDYTEFCWHAPTVRLYISRPMLAPPGPGYAYPPWVMNALGGIPCCIDPTILSAGKTIGCTILDLLTRKALLQRARDEFNKRTGGGVGGDRWMAPLCDYDAPVDLAWPEYVTTARGEHLWCVPAANEGLR